MCNPSTANAKPPSRAPSCIGKKNIRLLNKEEKASINTQSHPLTSGVKTLRIMYISRLESMRAESSNSKEL